MATDNTELNRPSEMGISDRVAGYSLSTQI